MKRKGINLFGLLLVAMLIMGAAGGIVVNNLILDDTGEVVWGDPSTNGSWKLVIENDTLKRQLRAGGVWGTVGFATVSGGGSVTWSTLSGKPSTFPPSAHIHGAADITSGNLVDARMPGSYDPATWNDAEPSFSKNTGFNKDFGTTLGTVAQGNDSRINNGQTAFGWGNHAGAGYLTSYEEIQDFQDVIDADPTVTATTDVVFNGNGSETFNLKQWAVIGSEGDWAHSGDFTADNVQIGTNFYISDPSVDGSWRMRISGANLILEKRESGSWVTKHTFTP